MVSYGAERLKQKSVNPDDEWSSLQWNTVCKKECKCVIHLFEETSEGPLSTFEMLTGTRLTCLLLPLLGVTVPLCRIVYQFFDLILSLCLILKKKF